jgi:CubicO group peptidase (beta-lactamase class C family)
MMHYRSFVALTLFLLHSLGASAVSAQTDQIDDYVQIEMKRRQIPGLALVVIRDGEVVKMKGYGFANLEHDVPVTTDTVFELASVTKQFTAAATTKWLPERKRATMCSG